MIKKGLKYLYIFTLCMAMFNKLPDAQFPWWFPYIHCIIWIGIYFIIKSQKLQGEQYAHLTQCLASIKRSFLIPWGIFIFVSPIGWALYIETTGINVLTRAFSTCVQFLLITFSVVMTAYIFKEKLLKYTFQAIVINYFIIIMITIRKCGLSDFVKASLAPLGGATTAGSNIAASILEVHDVTFAAGFFFIYFLIWYRKGEKKYRLLNLFLSIALLYLGYKRIELGALAIVIFFALLINTKSKQNIKFWSVVYSLGMLLVMYIFIWLIDTGLLSELAEQYNISFMGRLKTYEYMSQYFSFSPFYIGRGMSAGIRLNLEAIAGGMSIIHGHSGIMFSYIDYGFWGFTLWILYCCYGVANNMLRKFGNDAAKLWMLFTTYAFITYTTDNTAGYFAFQTSYMVIMFHTIYTKKKLPTLKT